MGLAEDGGDELSCLCFAGVSAAGCLKADASSSSELHAVSATLKLDNFSGYRKLFPRGNSR